MQGVSSYMKFAAQNVHTATEVGYLQDGKYYITRRFR